MAKGKRLSDDEILSICNSEIDAASGYASGELANERATAMDYYLGEPYGDEQEGRSQFVSREVLETVENIMPSLMRIFGEADNLIEFDPVGHEDVEQAQQESDRVSYAFWKENRGFFNLYSFCKDALLSKTGILQVSWEEGKEEREEYEGLSEFELVQLVQDPLTEREMEELTVKEDGTMDVLFTATPKGRAVIEPVPPEELGVNRDARTPYAQDAQFLYLRKRKTKSDLLQEGYDEEEINTIPTNDDVETEERLARRNLTDESDILRTGDHPAMRMFWVTECYIRIDRDGDGIDELIKATVAAGASQVSAGARLLGIEEVDHIPVFTAPPTILTHKYYGLSVADLVLDIQHIMSTLERQVLDNVYLTNNSSTHINEAVNQDDMLTKRPGRLVRHEGKDPPGNNIAAEPQAPLPSDVYQLMERMDEAVRSRTGAAEDVAGLDVGALAQLNTGVAAMALDRVRMKVELIAQILAEIGLRPLFQYLHQVLQKKQDKREVLQLRGKWVDVNPSEWRDRQNVTVKIGVGQASRERKLMGLEDIWQKQQAVVQGGGLNQILMPDHIYNLLTDYTEAWGMDSERYWLNPQQAPPPEPPPPDPQLMGMQVMEKIEMAKLEDKREQRQFDGQKLQMEFQIESAKLDSSSREGALQAELTALKGQREAVEFQLTHASGNQKAALELELQERDQRMQMIEAQMEDERKASGQQIDLFKALLQHSGATPQQLAMAGVEMPEPEEEEGDDLAEMKQYVTNLLVGMQEMREREAQPKTVERDGNGRAVSVGGRPVTYSPEGLIERIG